MKASSFYINSIMYFRFVLYKIIIIYYFQFGSLPTTTEYVCVIYIFWLCIILIIGQNMKYLRYRIYSKTNFCVVNTVISSNILQWNAEILKNTSNNPYFSSHKKSHILLSNGYDTCSAILHCFPVIHYTHVYYAHIYSIPHERYIITSSVASHSFLEVTINFTTSWFKEGMVTVSYTHLTLPTNREV